MVQSKCGQYNQAMTKKEKNIANSTDAYSQLKVITDAAQAGQLSPWGTKVTELLNAYGIIVDRREGIKAEITLSFPTTTKRRSMGIGVRYLKPDGSYAEDFFLFEESVGLTCYYKGAQENALPEYKGTHHGPPTVALQESLPSIQQDIDDLKHKLQLGDIFNTIDMSLIVTPSAHQQNLANISQEYQRTTASISARVGGSQASYISMQLQPEFTKKRTAQMERWSTSENIYDLKLEQIGDIYPTGTADYERAVARLNRVFGK